MRKWYRDPLFYKSLIPVWGVKSWIDTAMECPDADYPPAWYGRVQGWACFGWAAGLILVGHILGNK